MDAIIIPAPDGDATMIGRNGKWNITALEAYRWPWGDGNTVVLHGLGRRGQELRGGFYITVAMMDALCSQWITARGNDNT